MRFLWKFALNHLRILVDFPRYIFEAIAIPFFVYKKNVDGCLFIVAALNDDDAPFLSFSFLFHFHLIANRNCVFWTWKKVPAFFNSGVKMLNGFYFIYLHEIFIANSCWIMFALGSENPGPNVIKLRNFHSSLRVIFNNNAIALWLKNVSRSF